MVKKSVSKAVSNVSGAFKSMFNTQNILSSIIVILLIVYMSFVNIYNVPKLFNNVVVKLLLFALIVYTFYQDKLVAFILAATVILSISLVHTFKNRRVEEVEDNNDNLVSPEISSESVPVPVNEENSLDTSINYQDSRMA